MTRFGDSLPNSESFMINFKVTMQRTQFKQFSARLELTAWRFLEVEENEMEIAAAMQWLSKCQGMSAAFEMQQCEKFQQRNVWCSLSLIANVRCKWLLALIPISIYFYILQHFQQCYKIYSKHRVSVSFPSEEIEKCGRLWSLPRCCTTLPCKQ